MANTRACKLNAKMLNGEAQATNTAAAVAAPVNTVKQIFGLFGKPGSGAATGSAARSALAVAPGGRAAAQPLG